MVEMYHFENITINRKCKNPSYVTDGAIKIEDGMLKIFSRSKKEVKSYKWLEIDLNNPLASGLDLVIKLKTEGDRFINVNSRKHQQHNGFVEAFNKMREQYRDESTKNTVLPKKPIISLNDAPNSSESYARYSAKSHTNPSSSTNDSFECTSREVNRNIERTSVTKDSSVYSPINSRKLTEKSSSSSSKHFPSKNTYSSPLHSNTTTFPQTRILGNMGEKRKCFPATDQPTKTNYISTRLTNTDQMRGSVSEASSASTSKSSSPLPSHGIHPPLRSQTTQCGSPDIQSRILPESNYVTPKKMKGSSSTKSAVKTYLHVDNNESYQNLSDVSRKRSIPVEQSKRDLSGTENKKVQPLVPNQKRDRKPPNTVYKNTFSDRKLPNTGNSCYFNSIMQAISSCPSIVSRCTQLRRLYPKKLLPSFAQNFDHTSANRSEARKVVEGVIWLISILLNKSEENVVLPDYKAEMLLRNVRRRMGKIARRFDNDEQHDAHDYLMLVFRCFDEVMTGDVEKDRQRKQAGILGNSSLHLNPNIAVRFKTEQSLYCPTCKKENFNTSIHEMLQVPLRYEKSTTLCDLLKTSFQGHTLERKCPQCECPVAYARDRIITFPQCLIMNLQRYRNIYQKNNSKVEVPMKLETSRFSSFSLISFDFNGNFMELNTRDELSDDIRRLGVKNITGGINNESGTPLLLGGAGDAESGSDDDCEILAEKVKFSFNFKLITHRKSVLEMVGKMDITANEESIKQHLKTLQRSPAMELDKKDEPGTTIKIETDGNCFFRAISWCLTGSQKYHKKVRKATVNYMKNSKQLLENSCNGDYEIHVRNMEYDQEWATECEIAAIANLLKVNIYTYLPTGWNCQTPKECVPTNIGSIYLNNQEEHYEPVVSLKKSPEQPKELRSHKRKPLDDDDDQDSEDIKKGRKVDGDPSEEKKPDESSSRKNPRRSCNEKTKQNSNSIQYNLVAVVCHEGQSLDNGHYYAYIKDMLSDSWYFSSDKTFRPASEKDVIDEVAPKAYLLFYDRQ